MKSTVQALQPGFQLRWGGRFASTKDVPWHTHTATELVAVTKGRCRIRVGEQALDGTRGAVFVLPARVAQYQETYGVTQTTYIGFDAPSGSFTDKARVLVLEPADPALQWIGHLCDSQRSRPPLSDEVNRLILLALLRRLAEMDASAGRQVKWHPAVRAARAYLEAHLQQTITLADVARAVGVSASHLSAVFAAECGVGPMSYLQRIRIEHACWLLSNPYLRIQEVANACGYEDVNYFTRIFHRHFGVPPGRWRLTRKQKLSPLNTPKDAKVNRLQTR